MRLILTIRLVFLSMTFTSYCFSQHTISGYIKDGSSGEPLPGASIIDTVRQVGTATNHFGFFSLQMPAADTAYFRISFVGYTTTYLKIPSNQDSLVILALNQHQVELSSIEITDYQDKVKSPTMSVTSLSPEEIERVPMLMGEADVMKAIQLLPGVQGGVEGSTNLHVRGGGPDQNLVLLDGVPVYNVSHLLGFLSVFNTSTIKKVSINKGGFPASYGGRLSSVIDIQLKEGNNQAFHGEGDIGLITSSLLLEGPIKDENTSFLLAGRRTWLDLFATIPKLLSNSGTTYNFYDLTGKINHRFSERDRLYLSLYHSNDGFGSRLDKNNNYSMRWGNLTSAIRWNHLYSKQLFSNVTAILSNYQFAVNTEEQFTHNNIITTSESRYSSTVKDLGIKVDFDYLPNPTHTFKFGSNITRHVFKPNTAHTQTGSDTTQQNSATFNDEGIVAWEGYLYGEDEIHLSDRWRTNIGVHVSGFLVDQTNYYSVQPRVSMSHTISNNTTVKASFVTMTQYLHLLSNTSAGIPTDIWVPSTNDIPPQQAWQAALGTYHLLGNGQFALEIEGYYKAMDGVLQFGEAPNFISDIGETDFLYQARQNWQDQVVLGEGWAYGAELLLRKREGRTTGWLSYTLSWSQRQFDDLNRGETFPYRYDRRHDISITLNHQFTSRIDAGINWVYMTGYAITLPEASYVGYDPFSFRDTGNFIPINYYESTNNYRVSPYHRLDLSVNFRKQKKKRERIWNISVYNAYNHRNPFFLYVDDGGTETRDRVSHRSLIQQSLFAIIPSVSYRIKF